MQQGQDGRPRLVVLDFGAISEARAELIEGLVDVVQGLFTGNGDKLIDGFLQMGFVAEGADRTKLGEITRTYFAKLMKFEDRSPGAFMKRDPRELAREFVSPEVDLDEMRDLMKSVHYPDTWFYVERATVLLFWLSAIIDPMVDTVKVGFPYVMPLLMQRNQRAAEERAANADARTSRPSSSDLTRSPLIAN